MLSGNYSDILSGILSGIFSDILSGIFSGIHSGILSGILSEILSGICIWHIFWLFWHSFWHSIWYIFGNSLWLRSGGDHCDHELAVEVWRGTLWSWACCSGPAGTTAITSLQVKSGGEHCHLALVQLRSDRGGGGGWRRSRRREAGRTADIKSNNPHLTGGELALRKPSLALSQPYIYIYK